MLGLTGGEQREELSMRRRMLTSYGGRYFRGKDAESVVAITGCCQERDGMFFTCPNGKACRSLDLCGCKPQTLATT